MCSIFHLRYLQQFYEVIVMCNFTWVNSNTKYGNTSTWNQLSQPLTCLDPRTKKCIFYPV